MIGKIFRPHYCLVALFNFVGLTIPVELSAQSISYAGRGFIETAANNGQVTGEISITLVGDSFRSQLELGNNISLQNVPVGLRPDFTIESGTSTWTPSNIIQGAWRSITFGNGLFVAVGDNLTSTINAIATSPDGKVWTMRSLPQPISGTFLTSVTYGNGMFVAVGFNTQTQYRIMTSPDGINWTYRDAPETWFFSSITYGDGLFVGVGGGVMTSPDGINWTAREYPRETLGGLKSVTYGNGVFVALSSSSSGKLMTSPDGVNWTSGDAAVRMNWQAVAFGNGVFVAVGAESVMTSADGLNWTPRSPAQRHAWTSLTYGAGQFVALSVNSNRGEPNRVMTSIDGINWLGRQHAQDEIGRTGTWTAVAYGNGKFVGVASGGPVLAMSASAKHVATLSLNGAATLNTDQSDTANVTFHFNDDAFSVGPASAITNATGPANSNLGIDFDPPIIDLSVSSTTGSERSQTIITVTAKTSRIVSRDITVNIDITGNGITINDYILSSPQITILGGMSTGTVSFTIQDDPDSEGNEIAKLKISSLSKGVVLGFSSIQNIIIVDNDQLPCFPIRTKNMSLVVVCI